MPIFNWYNRLLARLPIAVVQALGRCRKTGNDSEVDVLKEPECSLGDRPNRSAALARLRTCRGRMPADFTFDRLDAHDER